MNTRVGTRVDEPKCLSGIILHRLFLSKYFLYLHRCCGRKPVRAQEQPAVLSRGWHRALGAGETYRKE